MESQALLLAKYYSISLICGVHNAIKIEYHKCLSIEHLDLGNIAVGQWKVISVDIINPTEVPFKLHEFYTNLK
jgi:hypothetical protein